MQNKAQLAYDDMLKIMPGVFVLKSISSYRGRCQYCKLPVMAPLQYSAPDVAER